MVHSRMASRDGSQQKKPIAWLREVLHNSMVFKVGARYTWFPEVAERLPLRLFTSSTRFVSADVKLTRIGLLKCEPSLEAMLLWTTSKTHTTSESLLLRATSGIHSTASHRWKPSFTIRIASCNRRHDRLSSERPDPLKLLLDHFNRFCTDCGCTCTQPSTDYDDVLCSVTKTLWQSSDLLD